MRCCCPYSRSPQWRSAPGRLRRRSIGTSVKKSRKVLANSQTTPFTFEGGTKSFEVKRLPFTGEKMQVVSFGKLKLTLASGAAISCKVSDAGNIWNTTLAEPGEDEIVLFVNLRVCVRTSDCVPGTGNRGRRASVENVLHGGRRR